MKAMATESNEPIDSSDYIRSSIPLCATANSRPEATMNVAEKATIARQLERLNVDVIEAGFCRFLRRRLRNLQPGPFQARSRQIRHTV